MLGLLVGWGCIVSGTLGWILSWAGNSGLDAGFHKAVSNDLNDLMQGAMLGWINGTWKFLQGSTKGRGLDPSRGDY